MFYNPATLNSNFRSLTQEVSVFARPKLGIIGIGMVGTPLQKWFVEEVGYKRGEDLFLYDIDPKKGYYDDINKADIIFICVPTPPNPDGSCNTSIVYNAVERLKDGKIVVIKSTVPPGTTEDLQNKYPNHRLLFNPEFLTERQAWHDFLKPDRQIVGFTVKSLDVAHLVLSLLPKAPFMSPWGTGTYQQIRITATEAEFIKYAGNIYFAMKVNWANALAKAAEKMEVDYENIRKGMAADYRIGDSHLDANHGGYHGFGGFCLPKDLAAFMAFAKEKKLSNVYILLAANWDFNEKELSAQGLTVEDVSRHDADLAKKLGKLEN